MKTHKLRICKSRIRFPLESGGFHPLVNKLNQEIKKEKKTISLFMINIDRLSLSVIITVYNCCNDWIHFL